MRACRGRFCFERGPLIDCSFAWTPSMRRIRPSSPIRILASEPTSDSSLAPSAPVRASTAQVAAASSPAASRSSFRPTWERQSPDWRGWRSRTPPCAPPPTVYTVSIRIKGAFRMRHLFTTVTIFLSLAFCAYAQLATTTALAGTATDTTGTSVPGAKVTAVNTGTHDAYPVVTNDQGYYNIQFIAVGDYDLT